MFVVRRSLQGWLVGLGVVLVCGWLMWATPKALGKNLELNIYNWDTFIAPDVLTEFEQTYHAKINYSIYGSSEELYATLKAGNPGYDVVFPADYLVQRMAQEGLLMPLELAAIPNRRHLDPQFLNPAYDPDNRYGLPYQWGTLGIGYNLEAIGAAIDSWAAMFTPRYAGKIAWLDDSRYTLGAVLIALGCDPNTHDPAEITQAKDFLLRQKDTIATFAPDTGQDLLTQGDVDLAFEWNGDVAQVMQSNPDLRYVLPKEGSIIWVDKIAIPTGAKHPALAATFINFILQPRIAAKIANLTHYGSPNLTARQQGLIQEADRANPVIYPSANAMTRLQYLKDLGDAKPLYEAAWKAVKATLVLPRSKLEG